MKGNNVGFTLLEVLIVVLIIGVLSAIAVPQYQKAVLKSRYSAMMPIAKALAEGNEIYYMEHGNYSKDPTELPVHGKASYPDGTKVLIYDEDGLSYVRATNDSVPSARYLVYQKHSENFADTTMCEANNDTANELCQALGGEEVAGGNSSGEDSWKAYLLSGQLRGGDSFSEVGSNSGEGGDDPQTPQCEGDAPSDVTASTSGATGTATCVNGKWVYEWTGGKVYSEWYETCNSGDTEYGCAGATFSGVASGCKGNAINGCAGSTFSGDSSNCLAEGCVDSTFSGFSSECYGKAANVCAGSTFSGKESHCYGYANNGCAGTTFSGEKSYCLGREANGCAGTTIQAGAYCHVWGSGGCDGAKYGEDPTGVRKGIGSCDDGQASCPTGVPLRGNWNPTNGSYDISGWKGNCCNPAYMVSGECPSGIAVCS